MSSRSLLRSRNLPTFVTPGLFVVMFAAGSIAFRGFFSLQNFLNLFIDNAFLLILGVGMTFVIIGGGIDLSVGFVLALSTMLVSSLLTKSHVSPSVVIPLVLAMGTALGLFMGWLIPSFNLQPFIIILAGLYLGRGLCYVVSIDTIPIADEFFTAAANSRIPLVGGSSVTPGTLIAVAVVLMGLPVARTKIAIYALSRFCSALAGIVFTFYMLSG